MRRIIKNLVLKASRFLCFYQQKAEEAESLGKKGWVNVEI